MPDDVAPPPGASAAAAPVLRRAAGGGHQHVSVHQPGPAEVPAHRGGPRPDPQQAPHPQPAGRGRRPAGRFGAAGGHAALQQHAGAAEGARASRRVRVRAREQRGGLLRQRGAEDRHAAAPHTHQWVQPRTQRWQRSPSNDICQNVSLVEEEVTQTQSSRVKVLKCPILNHIYMYTTQTLHLHWCAVKVKWPKIFRKHKIKIQIFTESSETLKYPWLILSCVCKVTSNWSYWINVVE